MIGEPTVEMLFVFACLVIACIVYDIKSTSIRLPSKDRFIRTVNWLFLGFTTAFQIMSRYGLSVLKNEEGQEELQISPFVFGMVSAVGIIIHGLGYLINGVVVDMLGPKTAMICGSITQAVISFFFGFVVSRFTPHYPSVVALFMFLYFSVICYSHTFATLAPSNMHRKWYPKVEKPRIERIWGVMAGFGFLLAFGLNDIIAHQLFQIHSVFYIHGWLLLGSSILCVLLLKETPPNNLQHMIEDEQHDQEALLDRVEAGEFEALRGEETETETETETESESESEGRHIPSTEGIAARSRAGAHVLRGVMSHGLVWAYGLAIACAGALREGLLNWSAIVIGNILVISQNKFSGASTSDPYQIMASTIPFAVMFAPWIQQFLPPASLFAILSALAFVPLLILINLLVAGATIGWFWVMQLLLAYSAMAVLIFALEGEKSKFAVRLAGAKLGSTTTGVLGMCQYIGAGIADIVLGIMFMLNEGARSLHSDFEFTKRYLDCVDWLVFMIITSILGCLVMVGISIYLRLFPNRYSFLRSEMEMRDRSE